MRPARNLELFAFTAFWLFVQSDSRAPPADLVVEDARIYTGDSSLPWARALAVRAGEITYVGDEAGARLHIGPRTRRFRLRGRLLLPGFYDSHAHPLSAGLQQFQCDLDGVRTVGTALARVEACDESSPGSAWIIGYGWEPSLAMDSGVNRWALDRIVPNRPVLLRSGRGGQTIWVNSAALQTAAIHPTVDDPIGGRIDRDRTGELTGLLRGSARRLVYAHAPAPSPVEYDKALDYVVAEYARVGVVGFTDAFADEQSLATYRRADSAGRLPLRVSAAIPFGAGLLTDRARIRQLVALAAQFRSAHLDISAVKLHLDGMPDIGTAALLQPYAAAAPVSLPAQPAGVLNFETDRLKDLVTALDSVRLQVHMHAVGDAAVRQALDAIARNRSRSANRAVIAHLFLVQTNDLSRFAELGVIANVQLTMAVSSPYNQVLLEPAVGPERTRLLHPLRTLLDAGARVAAGSDWPDEPVNPLIGIQAAVTRRAPAGAGDTRPWHAQQRITLPEALHLYTTAGAFQAGRDSVAGSLNVGKRADFIVLSRDIFTIPASEFHQVKVIWTVLDGETVYGAGRWES